MSSTGFLAFLCCLACWQGEQAQRGEWEQCWGWGGELAGRRARRNHKLILAAIETPPLARMALSSTEYKIVNFWMPLSSKMLDFEISSEC